MINRGGPGMFLAGTASVFIDVIHKESAAEIS